ncbi:MAG TPA: META domain-containing protein [Candidatus Limnocylindria bacterium]|nr:META domain-containing protein [Candidatus Limnocylindria bacterium]
MNRSLLSVLAVVLLAACSVLPSSGAPDGAWQLTSGSLRGEPITPAEGAPVTLTLAGTEASGSSGCNAYSGPVSVSGDQLTFGDLMGTLIGCEREQAQAESMYLEALRVVERVRRNGDRLTLSGPEAELVFALIPPVADAPLANTTWQLETVVDGDTAMSIAGSDAIQATFADGSVTITVGCRALVGSYALADDRATATDLDVAEVAMCDPTASTTEDRIVADLRGGFTASVAGDLLQVTTPAGIGLEFRAAE